MPTLQDAMAIVDQLTPDERQELRVYLDEQQTIRQPTLDLTPEERARRLNEAFDQLREGLSESDLAAITVAMNEEYIEPWDESEWTD